MSPLLGRDPSTAFLPSSRNAESSQSARGLWAWGLTPRCREAWLSTCPWGCDPPGAGRPGSAHAPGDVPSRVPLSPPPWVEKGTKFVPQCVNKAKNDWVSQTQHLRIRERCINNKGWNTPHMDLVLKGIFQTGGSLEVSLDWPLSLEG